jgi:hypothetical protein
MAKANMAALARPATDVQHEFEDRRPYAVRQHGRLESHAWA